MKNLGSFLLICFIFNFGNLFGDEKIEALVNKYPSVIANYSSFIKPSSNIKVVWSRTDMLELFSINQVTFVENQIQIKNIPVSFLSPEKSAERLVDYYGRVAKLPLIIYKWEIALEKEGEYLLTTPIELTSNGFLNKEHCLVISNGIISKKKSGQLLTHLVKGKNILYLITIPISSSLLNIVSENDFDKIKNEIVKKVTSTNKEDITWVTTIFIPYLGTLQNGNYPYIIAELARINSLRPFSKTEGINTLLKSLVLQNNTDNYMIEKYIYSNFPNLYFSFSKNADPKDAKNILWSSFIMTNNEPRTIFLQQLIFDGQKDLANKYFSQCMEVVENNQELSNKDKFISAIYSERFTSLFKIGRIKEASELLKITQEKCNPFPLAGYINNRPDQEDIITMTQSFDETASFQIKEKLENYDGSAEELPSIYKVFQTLPNKLVKRNDGAISLFYLFHITKNSNEKLKNDFDKFCLDKIKPKIEKAREMRNIKLIEEVLEQYEMVIPMPDLHLILMEEFFKAGGFLKSLAQAYLIYEKHPELLTKIISKMVMLENISEFAPENRKEFGAELLKSEVKIMGQTVSLEKLQKKDITSVTASNSIGKLSKIIPLEPVHSQYWNHPQILNYQPIEPLFTNESIILNGGSYLINYSIKKNDIDWNYQSEAEYKKYSENGPHQKRFITHHSGNQLFMYTNRMNSEQKSIKSFDLKGNRLWDMSDQSITLIEEPLCTPIESQGKLFGLCYNHENISFLSYCVYDSSNGNLIRKTPISYMPTNTRDSLCRTVNLYWNTFTHDNHFTQDNSFVYGYTGTGVIFKADSTSGQLLWLKGLPKTNFGGVVSKMDFWNTYGYAPSGYIRLFGDVLLCFAPDSQIFTAINKNSGETIWKTSLYTPQYIHDRNKTNFLYFSSSNVKKESIIYKVNPQNGETLWQSTANGLVICGEGDILGEKLYIPSEKSIIEIDINSGKLTKNIEVNIQPLKIRCSQTNTVVLTDHSAFIFQNDGNFSSKEINEINSSIKVPKIFEPDVAPTATLSFENLNLEKTLKISETYYTNGDRSKKTQLIRTSKPFHFILKANDHLTLFREGYYLKSGLYIPPEILWFGQYQCYDIYEDTFYISENGKITASNLFTREIIWIYEYDRSKNVVLYNWQKSLPVIAVSKQCIAYQTENGTIRILDRITRNLILEFYMPTISVIRMADNYIITSNGYGPVRCYDIAQKGKELWMQSYDHYGDLFIENGQLVFVKGNSSIICFYDIKTGELKLQATSTYGSDYYCMNRWKIDGDILYAYKSLYDSKTGKPLEKYQAGNVVIGGGFIGFFKRYGQEGNYIENGKEFAFKTKAPHSDDNYHFTPIKKGNRITIFSYYYVETFEITNDKLISVEFSNINAGSGSNSLQVNLDLFVLDNSLLDIRKDEMCFFRNFDPELNYEKINSFRVENKRKFQWPFSELYPEIEVTESNWISNYGQKSKRKLFYLAFSDESFAYFKFKISPQVDKECTNTLYISADGTIGKISLIWDTDNWNNAQCSLNVNSSTESWKEIDIQGNISLYIKMRLNTAFPRQFKHTLPHFSIEMRQMSGGQHDGDYRLGGSYCGIIDVLPWMNYTNNESQSLKDFTLRTALYEEKANFYPQGIDLVSWLTARRKFKSVENNIQVLNNMLEINVKNYCCVNILSALLLEEILYLKINQPNINEFSEEFSQKIYELILKINKNAIEKRINKEWIDFALSFWTLEVFPNRFTAIHSGDIYTKPYYGVAIKSGAKVVFNFDLLNKNNLISPFVNQPFIEWVLPGLIPNFPQSLELNTIGLLSSAVPKTALGKMVFYSPNGAKEFCNRKGKMTESNKITKDDSSIISIKEAIYIYQNQKYDCFTTEHSVQLVNLSITVPSIKSPSKLKETGQTPESIIYALENLPSDNNNGLMLIDNYLTMKGKTNENELITVYGKWLNSLKNNSLSCYNALASIYYLNQSRKDIFEYIGLIIKESKLSTQSPRRFYLDRRNIFNNKDNRSVMGPIFNELNSKPEQNFNPLAEYKTTDSTHKFNDTLDAKKGGFIYLATKISAETDEKAFLFIRAINSYEFSFTSTSFFIWLNGKLLVENTNFLDFEDSTFIQKIALNKGDNILLIKIIGMDNYEWGRNYAICIGDVYGAPIKEISLKPVHK